MRIGCIRSDIGGIYISDVENTSQRNFSSEPFGQSRNLKKPSSDVLSSVLGSFGSVSVLGSNTSASVDTSSNNTLRIRQGSGSFLSITVPTGASVSKASIATSLTTVMLANGMEAMAAVSGNNQILIYSTGSNKGPSASLEIDTVANGSTLSTAVGFNSSGVTLTGLSVSSLVSAVYPTASTIDVSSATILALSSFSTLLGSDKTALVNAIADAVAPHFIETELVVQSATSGQLSKLASSGFHPGYGHTGLPAGAAVVLLSDDGSSNWTI